MLPSLTEVYRPFWGAPLVARDLVIVGGWVTDNQLLGNPSGVIRAYSARDGRFMWAWDLGKPEDHGMPDEGGQFTRGTPNYDLMSPDLANVTRAQLPMLQADISKLGAIKTVTFNHVGSAGLDVYDVTLASGAIQFGIFVTPG